jgi:Gamma tubulin complex component C-terminal
LYTDSYLDGIGVFLFTSSKVPYHYNIISSSRFADYYQEYAIKPDLRPGFVSSSAAASILFIGRSLNHVRVKGASSSHGSLGLVPSHLRLLSSLSFPVTASSFSNVIIDIRQSLSRNALEKLLPMSRISEILSLLHEFFLLGRGQFAVALISEADEKIRSRWRRADNLAYDKRDRLGDVIVKDGEVSAVLARTWAAMASLRGDNDNEEHLELARELIHFNIVKQSSSATPQRLASSTASQAPRSLVRTPFDNLLLSVSTQLTLEIPSPLDLFLTTAEVQTYSTINSYLLSIRRAHIRLSDLWKITSLRRHHPAPPAPPYGSTAAGQVIVHKLRARARDRGMRIRSVWATSSAALFLLGETEAYLHGEIVKGTWISFQQWLTGLPSRPASAVSGQAREDLWAAAGTLPTSTAKSNIQSNHDPQTLSDAHKRYLDSLTQDLLLTKVSFTEPLYHLLQQIDHLVALVHRIHSIWQSLDLEADDGVVDAFSDFHKEEKDVEEQLAVITGRVKDAIQLLIQSLQDIDQEKDDRYDVALDAMSDETAYIPQKMSRVDRLLMKLDFGGWFDANKGDGDNNDHENSDEELDN